MKKLFIAMLALPLFFHIPIEVDAAEKDTGIQEEVIYDILVDRFNNGDQNQSAQVRLDDPYAYHGGDLKGIEMKLDVIKELGFTAISLSPIMDNAPDGYHGYWIEDFYQVEEQFGSLEDFQRLVEEAHKRNLKVILEFVPNYVADSSPIANDPTKKDWLKQTSTSENVSEYQWAKHVVPLNQDNEEVQDYLIDAAKFWVTETNIDGLKLHAADQASTAFLEKFMNDMLAINPDLYILANVVTDTDVDKLLAIPQIQLVENQQRQQSLAETFAKVDEPVEQLFQTWEKSGTGIDLTYVDNKSIDRFTQVFADNGRNAVTTWQLALTYLYTTPGVPIIYQGSEIPMYGEGIAGSERMVDFNSGDADLKEFYERISSLRAEFPPLVYGDFELVGSSKGMSVFKRSYENETMYIAINNDSESRVVSITGIEEGKQLRGLLGDNIVRSNEADEFKIGLSRETAEVFTIETETGLNWLFIGPIIGVFLIFVLAVIYLSRKQKQRD